LQDRTKNLALRVARLVATLPNMPFGRTIANQIIRSATSVAANYRAACRGRSRAEFIAKLGITIEEADESLFWLELAIAGKLVKKELVKISSRRGERDYRNFSRLAQNLPRKINLQSAI